MKIVSYNLRFGGQVGTNNAWQRLVEEIRPDIVCAQESFNPRDYFPGNLRLPFSDPVWEAVPERKWGCAIACRGHALERVVVPGFEGQVVGALARDVLLGGKYGDLFIFSVHGAPPYEAEINRLCTELTKITGGRRAILAGDFNVTAAKRHPSEQLKNSGEELRILERFRKELRVFNAWQVLHPNCDLPQTLRWTGAPQTPYHCDAVFVGDVLLAHLSSAEVLDSGYWATASDHNPVVVTLE